MNRLETAQAASPVPLSEDDERVEDELLRSLVRQNRRVLLPLFVSDAVLAMVVGNRIEHAWHAWLWLALVGVVLVARFRLFEWLLVTARLDCAGKLRAAVTAISVNGVAHAAVVLFLPALPGAEAAFLSLLLQGFCAGSIATSTGYRPAFLAFVAPVLLALSASWAVGAGDPVTRVTELLTALLILVFGALLLQARDAFRMFNESFEIRRQHADLNRQLRTALDDAEAANRAKTRFLASASHDLRQPMHTLTLFGAALTLRPLDDTSRRIAEDMSLALESLGAQLDALLDISKLDAGVVPVRPSVFFVADFLQRIASDCRPLASRKGLALDVQCPPNAVCATDQGLLARIVRNLVDNAIKYTAHGTVALRVDGAGAYWNLTIADTGIGIDAADQHRVFEEFYQVGNPERDRSRGLGLGLSIVRRLSKLLGLGLRMTSTSGQGTQFVLAVPRSDPSALALPDGDEAMPLSLRGLCVLVVDDEESVRKGMQSLLEALGARVLLAGCIAGALRQAGDHGRPDIVLADLRLRGDETGLEAVAQLRRLQPGLPALFISGDIAPDRLQDAQAAGVALLHKPVPVAALCAAIEQAIRNGENDDTRKKTMPADSGPKHFSN